MKQSQGFKKKRLRDKILCKKISLYFRMVVILVFTLASIGYAPPLDVQAAGYPTNGTANGTYAFGGPVGADNSAGAGFATFSDKFVINNGFEIEEGTTRLSSTNYNFGAQETLIIKAEGGEVCKTFTFKDLGISLYHDIPNKETLSTLNLVVKGPNGNPIQSYQATNIELNNNEAITSLSSIFNNNVAFNHTGVASLEITWTFAFSTTYNHILAPANLNFETITIADVAGGASDTVIPTISTNTISVANTSTTGVTLNWATATDNLTPSNDLEYELLTTKVASF